jgi:internalin A
MNSTSVSHDPDYALQLILKAIDNCDCFIDLGNCGLTEIPEALVGMAADLQGLSLGESFFYPDATRWHASENQGLPNRIQNIDILAQLPHLRTLSLYGNAINDLSALSDLSALEHLSLQHNPVMDVQPLKYLTNLVDLNLSHNQISDITPLANLTNLRELYLDYNEIRDVSALSLLTNLNYLNLSNNKITDIYALVDAVNLVCLNVSDNWIEDITPISTMPQLTDFFAANNRLSSLYKFVFKNSVILERVVLSGNQISDVTPLQYLSNLQILYLNHNLIQLVTNLAVLTNLLDLDLSNNKVLDIMPLSALTGLIRANLHENKIERLPKSVIELPDLAEITLTGNLIDTVDAEYWNLVLEDGRPANVLPYLKGYFHNT